ncbi:MAG: DUF6265 family protein [Bacteroidota bacterium]|nr:DUF6265 family protein [Bacteroidota bacterium]
MKIVLFLFVCTQFISAQHKQTVSNLEWISGHWEMVKGERRTEEFWFSSSGNILLGISKSVRGSKLIEHEFMSIDQDSSGDIYYRAKPSSQPEASFKLIGQDSKKIVFENLQHDFPQRIIYEQSTPESLNARIEGVYEGKLLIIHYPYRKIKN